MGLLLSLWKQRKAIGMRDLKAALFDFDGVVMDTESQYSTYWNEVGKRYLGVDGLEMIVKGQTLENIINNHFPNNEKVKQELVNGLRLLEQNMTYNYVPGVVDFICDLRKNGVKTAIVTSSNKSKMAIVYNVHPEVTTMVDRILTSEYFSKSKPDPDCYLLGMKIFDTKPENTVVFEDSISGLKSGMASGATVIGLTTTYSLSEISPLCHVTIKDFKGLNFKGLSDIFNLNR